MNTEKNSKIYVLYHAFCPDGFAAAAVCWRQFRERAEYIAVSYGETVPEMVDGSEVWIVDFSYPKAVLGELARRMAKVVVLDHHKTAEEELAGDWAKEFPNLSITFDMEKCGAVLTWEHFFGSFDVPLLLLYVQDRDLWRWKLPDSRAVSMGLRFIDRDFKVWNGYLDTPRRLLGTGRIALNVIDSTVREICKKWFPVLIDGHAVPCVNTSVFHSECGELLKRLNPDAPFVAIYMDMGLKRKWSLRSGPDFDVSAVAKKFGGGGHAAAAGFETVIDHREQNPEVSA